MSDDAEQVDWDAARISLSKEYSDVYDDESKLWRRLKTYAAPEYLACATQICDTGVPKLNRLCFLDDAENLEVVLDVQGVLVDSDLPPVERSSQIPKNLLVARQNVEISGLGLGEFAVCEEAIRQIDDKFQNSIKAGFYEPFSFNEVLGYPSMVLSNRYFTPAHLAPANAVTVDFSAEEDPRHHLANVAKSKANFLHLEDNVVRYYARRPTAINGKIVQAIQPANPACFRLGQVVEAQISFLLVPTMNRKYKLHLTLRSLAMLSNRKVLRPSPSKILQSLSSRRLKRCVGYEDGDEQREVRRIRTGFAHLHISDDSNRIDEGARKDSDV